MNRPLAIIPLSLLPRLRHALVLIGFTAALVTASSIGEASAGGVQVLPSQTQPSLPPRLALPPNSSQQEQTIPSRPVLPLPDQGSNTREIPLPKVFRGCWRGSVPTVDSITLLQPDEPRISWLT